jgi:hypothetical protein
VQRGGIQPPRVAHTGGARSVKQTLMILLLMSFSICAAGCGPSSAGQTKGPFALWVFFRAQTGVSSASKVVKECGRQNAGVVAIRRPADFQRELRIVFLVQKDLQSAQTQALKVCIQKSPAVSYVAYPS